MTRGRDPAHDPPRPAGPYAGRADAAGAADDADLAATPVLMLTARGQTGDDGARADAVLAKPFDNQELRATVRRMLA